MYDFRTLPLSLAPLYEIRTLRRRRIARPGDCVDLEAAFPRAVEDPSARVLREDEDQWRGPTASAVGQQRHQGLNHLQGTVEHRDHHEQQRPEEPDQPKGRCAAGPQGEHTRAEQRRPRQEYLPGPSCVAACRIRLHFGGDGVEGELELLVEDRARQAELGLRAQCRPICSGPRSTSTCKSQSPVMNTPSTTVTIASSRAV